MSPANEERPSLYEFMPYGAPELMEVARKYMFRATISGIGSIVGVFVIMFTVNLIIARQQEAIPVVQMQVSDLAAPPPLSQDTPPPQVQVSPAAAPPAAAIPVPVPDAEAPQEQTIMSQEEISTSTPVRACLARTGRLVAALREAGVPVLCNPHSLTVVFPQPSEAIVRTFQLACNKGEAHAIVMPNVTDALIGRFVADYLAWWKASR